MIYGDCEAQRAIVERASHLYVRVLHTLQLLYRDSHSKHSARPHKVPPGVRYSGYTLS